MPTNKNSHSTILPTSYDRKKILLTTNNTKGSKGFEFDINNLVTSIKITENIEGPGLNFTFSLGDTENFIERSRLSGNEKILVELERDAPYGKEKYSIDLRVIEIMNFVKQKRGLTTYQMKCVSPHIIDNQVVSLGNAFKGSVGSTIKNICLSSLGINKEKLEIDTAVSSSRGVFPNIKPLSAIKLLIDNTSDNGTPYYFYETLTNGIKFKSLKTLLNQEPFDTYEIREASITNIESDKGYEDMRTRIIEMSSDYSASKYMGLKNGAYASTSFFVDVGNKTLDPLKFREQFQYSYDMNTSIEKHKPFPDLNQNNLIKEKGLKDFPESKKFFINLNTESYDGSDNLAQGLSGGNLAQMYSHLENMEFQTHNILIPGDFRLNVGMVINIRIPATSQEGKFNREINTLQSGKYLITRIEHTLDTHEYLTQLTIKRNSSTVDLDGVEDIK